MVVGAELKHRAVSFLHVEDPEGHKALGKTLNLLGKPCGSILEKVPLKGGGWIILWESCSGAELLSMGLKGLWSD